MKCCLQQWLGSSRKASLKRKIFEPTVEAYLDIIRGKIQPDVVSYRS